MTSSLLNKPNVYFYVIKVGYFSIYTQIKQRLVVAIVWLILLPLWGEW